MASEEVAGNEQVTPDAAPEASSAEPEVEAPTEVSAGKDQLIDTLSGLGKAAEETLSTLSDGLDGAEDAVREGLEKAEGTIREHPLVAVGLAAGLGFVLGLLIRGDRD